MFKSYKHSPVSWSVVTAAVRPTPDEPRPVVATALGAVCSTYLLKRAKQHILAQQVCLLLNGTSALFIKPLVPRIVEVEHMRHVKSDL